MFPPVFDHGQVTSGDPGQSGQDLLGHAALCSQDTDDLSCDLAVEKHDLCSFLKAGEGAFTTAMFFPRIEI